MTGVYRLRNIYNNKCYYGSSQNIEKRFKRHIKELKDGTHINISLRRAWEKYGEDVFVLEIVEECTIGKLHEREQIYLDTYPEYNIAMTATGGDNLTRNPNRDVIIDKMTKSVNARYASMTDEEKKAKYGRKGDRNCNWRGGHKTFCKCGNEISAVAKCCTLCRDRTGKNNPFFGKTHSEEYKKHSSEIQKGIYRGSQNIPLIIDGIEYSSLGEASIATGIHITTIRWRIRSKNKKFDNYKYK